MANLMVIWRRHPKLSYIKFDVSELIHYVLLPACPFFTAVWFILCGLGCGDTSYVIRAFSDRPLDINDSWWVTLFIGIWPIFHLHAPIKLAMVDSKVHQNHYRRLLALCREWYSTQYMFLMWELLIIALLTYERYYPTDSNVAENQHEYMRKRFIASCTFFGGCGHIRLCCIVTVKACERNVRPVNEGQGGNIDQLRRVNALRARLRNRHAPRAIG